MKILKKVEDFINDNIKALTFSLGMIAFYELFNLIVSIGMGYYVRIEGGTLENIIRNYIEVAVIGFGFGWIRIIFFRIQQDNEMSVVQGIKKIIIYSWIIICLVCITCCVLLGEYKKMMLIIVGYTLAWGFTLFVVYVLDKRMINKINKKIK